MILGSYTVCSVMGLSYMVGLSVLQICRVEDIIVEGLIEGSVVHFHWVRTVVVHRSGVISASGLGMNLAP